MDLGGGIRDRCSFDDDVMMMMCAFDFALMRRVLALLCLFSTHNQRDLYLV